MNPQSAARRSGPERIVLLYADRTEPVSSLILDHRTSFGVEVIALSLAELVNEVEVGTLWKWKGEIIDPLRTAVVNRLTSLDGAIADGAQSPFRSTQLSVWLYDELKRFLYASSLPGINAPIGGFGSLVDQWLDLPLVVEGLRVPVHGSRLRDEAPAGEVYFVNPWSLYSLGRRAMPGGPARQRGEVAYLRPGGGLFHVAQVGGLFIAPNAPPDMTPAQQDYVMRFVRAMASRSRDRILEHAFFAGSDVPVFYSTFPVPVMTGRFPAYRDLILRGLREDVDRYHGHAAP